MIKNNINTAFFCHMQNLDSEMEQALNGLTQSSDSSTGDSDSSDSDNDNTSSFIYKLISKLGMVSSGYKANLSHCFL